MSGGRKEDAIARVRRLIENRCTPRHIDQIFAWLRFHAKGRYFVRDLGDFAAHPEGRDKGKAWEGVQQKCDMFAFQIPRIEQAPAVPDIVTKEELARFKAGVLATFSQQKDAEIQRIYGITKNRALERIKRGLRQITGIVNGQVVSKGKVRDLEAKLIEDHAKMVISAAAYDAEQLLSEFVACLLDNDMISIDEVALVERQRSLLARYAIEKMHRATMLLRDGSISHLYAHVSDQTSHLDIYAINQVKWRDNLMDISSPIFSSGLTATEAMGKAAVGFHNDLAQQIELELNEAMFLVPSLIKTNTGN